MVRHRTRQEKGVHHIHEVTYARTMTEASVFAESSVIRR